MKHPVLKLIGGALLLAMDPVQPSSMSVNETLKSMTPPERLCLVIDPASGAVTGSSAEELTGTRAESLGFDDARLQGKYMDYFKILDAQYYGVSIERDGLVYYSLRNVEGDLARAVRCGGIACAGYAAAYLILAAYLLTGYTQKRFDYYATIGRSVSTSVVETMTPDGKLKRTIDPSRRWAFDFATWRNMLPEQKTKAVLLALIALEMMNVIPTFFRGASNNDILNFILMGQWKRGVSLFSLTAILLLIMATALGVLLMRFALKLLSSVLGTKGETVCRLTYSLIQYAALLAVLFYGFDYFGLDVRALLAPLALVSLALSLGSKDLVQDVLAGTRCFTTSSRPRALRWRKYM